MAIFPLAGRFADEALGRRSLIWTWKREAFTPYQAPTTARLGQGRLALSSNVGERDRGMVYAVTSSQMLRDAGEPSSIQLLRVRTVR